MSKNLIKDIDHFQKLATDLILDQEEKAISVKINPEDVLKRLNISLEERGVSDNQLIKDLKDISLNTPKTSSNLFFNQLFGGVNSKAVLGDLISIILNNSMSTYKIAGPMVEVEKEIIRKVCEIINYPKTSGGTFPTGGSMSNFMSLVMSRDLKDDQIRDHGRSKDLICYTSDTSHYSISKNASFTGIGRKNTRYIETDYRGEMIVEKLQEAIDNDLKNNKIPILVNATMGTTVLGAIDPVKEISKICKKHKIWLHIDGAYLGTLIFSKLFNNLTKDIHLSDSFCFNAHKTLGAPLSTSILVVKDNDHLLKSFGNEADYLYQTDDSNYNLGQKSFECGRKNNALKMWTLWKSVGTMGIGEMIEKNYKLANIAYSYVKNNKDYTLFSQKESLSICFNYKNYDPVDLCTALYNENKVMVGYGHHKKNKFIRFVCVNRDNSEKDILNFFKILENFADNQ